MLSPDKQCLPTCERQGWETLCRYSRLYNVGCQGYKYKHLIHSHMYVSYRLLVLVLGAGVGAGAAVVMEGVVVVREGVERVLAECCDVSLCGAGD